MLIHKTEINGLLEIMPTIFNDERGYFFESYQQQIFAEYGIIKPFVQDNQSCSAYGTIRGMHFQRNEWAQAKLVRVLVGAVYDVVIDMREDSSTYGKWFGCELSAENQKMLYIPRGCAHGFASLKEGSIFFYKCDNYYNASADGGIFYDDPVLQISWPIPLEKRIISQKDQQWPLFSKT